MTERATSTGAAGRSGSRSSLVGTLVRKELREVVRDGRFRVVGLVAFGLLVASLAFGLARVRAVATERQDAQREAEHHWQTQDAKNPHVAAHYGTHVFKPTGALPFVDPGIEPFVGSSAKLEAHRRNDLEASPALDATGLSRFGGLSVSAVLQLLVPLLVIALGFGAWSAERERGTLRQLASLGVAPRVLVSGKALGIVAALGAVLGPALALGAAATWVWAPPAGSSSLARFAAMALSYLAFFGVFVGLTLAVSARASTSRGALVALLGFWVWAALIVPRAAADAAAHIAPAPSHAAIDAAVRESLERGLPGGPPREERLTAITEAMMEAQGWKGAEMLMDAALLGGIELQSEAAYENEVIDHHFAQLAAAIETQERWAEAAAVLSPVVAVRTLSMAFAGTDFAHHRRFADAAEAHRRALVDMLNQNFAEKAGTAAWDYRAGRELWEKAPAFRHEPPPVAWVASQKGSSVLALVGWLALATIGAWQSAVRMRVA